MRIQRSHGIFGSWLFLLWHTSDIVLSSLALAHFKQSFRRVVVHQRTKYPIPSSRGRSLCRHPEDVVCAVIQRTNVVLSSRGRSLCRHPEDVVSAVIQRTKSEGSPRFALSDASRYTIELINGLWRSLVARLSGGQEVVGSSPASPTNRVTRDVGITNSR